MHSGQAHIVIIDDDAPTAEAVVEICESLGYSAQATHDAAAFLDACRSGARFAFVDLRMPEVDGVELLHALSQLPSPPQVIPISGMDDAVLQTTGRLAVALGLHVPGTLRKPFGVAAVRRLLERPRVTAPRAVPAGALPGQQEVAEALRAGAFEVHFEPQISCETGRTVGAEALVRWRDGDRGWIPPLAFLPVVRHLGGMGELTRQVIEASVAALVGMRAVSPSHTVSINVPVESLVRDGVLTTLLQHLERAGLPAESATLEITEDQLVDERPETLDALVRVRMAGVALSIDDFGSGFSHLLQTRQVPASELKIDQALVADLGLSENSDFLVRHVVELGHGLGMKVVAEGVTRTETAALLRLMGCDVAQGFLWSHALPVDRYVRRLEEEAATPGAPRRTDPAPHTT